MKHTQDHELGKLLAHIESAPRQGFFEDLERLVEQEEVPSAPFDSRQRVPVWPVIGFGAIAAAAAVVVAIVLGSVNIAPNKAPKLASPSTQPITASQVITLASTAYSSTQNLQAQVEYSLWSRGRVTSAIVESHTYTAVVSANGDFSLKNANGAKTIYSAESGVLLDCPPGASVTCDRDEGLTASDPRTQAADRLGLDRLLSLLHAGIPSTTVPETATFEGRTVWKIDLTYSDYPAVNPNYAPKDVHSTLLVDKATDYPLQAVTYVMGKPYESVTLHNVRLDRPVPSDAFSTDPPSGDSVRTYPGSASRVPLAAIAGLPTSVPKGFVLSEASTDASDDTTTVTYRMGLQRFTLTYRSTPSNTDFLFDSAFVTAPGEATLSETTAALTSGRLDGQEAHIRISTVDLKAYVVADKQLVTVEGDLDPPVAKAIFEALPAS